MDLPTFIEKWREDDGGEDRANKRRFLLDLCAVLDVPTPNPKTGDRERDAYVFEADVLSVHEGYAVTTLKVDLYKRGAFLLEAKQGSEPGAPKVGCGRRSSHPWQTAMAEARGQAIGCARSMDDPPPFVVVCDIGYMFELYADFARTGNYVPFPNARTNRLFVLDLALRRDTLRALFLDARALDPSQVRVKVTRDVAGDIAELAKLLEKQGHRPDAVAKFLMRCLFTMFVQDMGLLPDELFTKALEQRWLPDPKRFPLGIQTLWEAMDHGASLGFGELFADPSALPVERDGLELLLKAAKRGWSDVEPAIFGTLLERALDPKERHALGAHFTPRSYVERLVRPTIEEPIRAAWENVQAAAHKLRTDGALDEARKVVHGFHEELCQTRVLDPACGSGNFLYVTLNILEQLESEALALLAALGQEQAPLLRVTPKQLLGIEVKPWAKQIAELVVWIGYLQSHDRSLPPEQDFQNIERRDAVLVWDKIALVRDEKTRVVVEEYVNPRKAEWPRADYVVGNPPFLGKLKMLDVLGEGYVRALRTAYADSVPDSVDYGMLWWYLAGQQVASGRVRRFGLVSTNSIAQAFNRRVVQGALSDGLHIAFAVPDHPWIDAEGAADVRIAMTVGAPGAGSGARVSVVSERDAGGEEKVISYASTWGSIHADLSVGVDRTQVVALQANGRLASPGVEVHGKGFVIRRGQARELGLGTVPGLERHVREYRNGKDLTSRARDVLVIDLDGLAEDDVKKRFPRVYQWLTERVKPERSRNREAYRRDNWWLFARRNTVLRSALAGLPRYIGTVLTARHRVFVLLDESVLPDQTIVGIGLSDAYWLGVLSCRVHVVWALSTGARLGVGNDPRYTKTRCFDSFPFPTCNQEQRRLVRDLAEQLDAHRRAQQTACPELTLTGMYNVLEKLRASADLTAEEREIHDRGLVGVLRSIHDDIDAAVFEAYGWPRDISDEQILEKLVALNAERAAEERGGLVRWLRPEFQNPTGEQPETRAVLAETAPVKTDEAVPLSPTKPWPKEIAAQVIDVRDRVAVPGKVFSVEAVAAGFKGAKRKDVEGILDGLAALGLLTPFDTPAGKRWRAVGKGTQARERSG